MALTLNDLNFEFNEDDLKDIEEQVDTGLIQPSTNIIDTPVIINNFLKDLTLKLKDLFNTNLGNLAQDFDSWYTQKTTDLKNEIQNNLALDSNTLYDIYVKHSQLSDDSDKFDGKTYTQMISDLYTNYITTATVTNSIKFNNKSMDEYTDYIKNTLKPLAGDSDKVYGYNYDQLKSAILSGTDSSGGGVDIDTVKNKVQNEWTAYNAKSTNTFGDNTADSWKTEIIPKIKVDNAVDADKFNNTDYDTMIESINKMIQNNVDNAISSDNDNLTSIIKSTKVDNAIHSDSSDNSTKFNNTTTDDWKNDIIPSIKVNNALYSDNSGQLGGLTSDEWQSKLDTLNDDIKNKVQTTWIAYKANEVLKINGVKVEDFDDHITDLIQDKLNNINDLEINAKKFDEKTPEEWTTDVIPNIKVNNSIHSDFSDFSTKADLATNANFLYDSDTGEYSSRSTYITYIKDRFNDIIAPLNITPSKINKFIDSLDTNYNYYYHINLIQDKQLIFKENNNLLNYINTFKIDSFIKNYSKKEYSYDGDNISEIKYYFKYLKYDESDATADPTTEEILIKQDELDYDDNNLTSLKETTIFFNFDGDFETDDITDDSNWLIMKFLKQTDFSYDDNGNLTKEEISYKLYYKLVSDDDDSWTEEDII